MNYALPQHQLVLASMSMTRRQMLENAGLTFTPAAAPVDEEALRLAGQAEGIGTIDMATALAEAKAARASQKYPEAFVIGADQLLECDGVWYGKPESRAAAEQTLASLSGKTHQLVTAAVVMQGGRRIWQHCDRPAVSIRTLDTSDIGDYLDAIGTAAFETPGCYQIEGLGAQIISKIDGCPYAILGLPLLQLLAFLRQHGLHAIDTGSGVKV